MELANFRKEETTLGTRSWEGGRPPVQGSPWAEVLFDTTRYSWLWLILRLYLGYEWFNAGYHKLGNPAWTQTGAALKGFWTNAVVTSPKPPISFDWYRAFIQYLLNTGAYSWFSKLVVFGEMVIGILLILGAFTGIAAFLGGFMNFNFMMAGSASTNPLLFTISILLILAWKVAGYYGLDRWLLPAVGTPWKLGEGDRPAGGRAENRPGPARGK